jgi:putative membrane protein
MKRKFHLSRAIATAMVAAPLAVQVLPAQAPAPAPAAAAEAAPLSATDRQFLEIAARTGLTEVQAGELAVQRASRPDVRAFARQMVAGHDRVNEELALLASALEVRLDARPDSEQQELLTGLAAVQGTDFDELYLKGAGVEAHEQAARWFATAAGSENARVRAFAEKHLEDVRSHLETARQLAGADATASLDAPAAP